MSTEKIFSKTLDMNSINLYLCIKLNNHSLLNKNIMNLRDEFINAIGQKTVLCAVVDEVELRVEYTQKEYETFLSKLNFQYHRDIDEIFGTVWFNDCTLLEMVNNSWLLTSLHG